MNSEQSGLFEEKKHFPAQAISDDPAGALDLFSVSGVGSARFRILMKTFGSPAEIFKVSETALNCVPGIDSVTAVAISSTKRDGYGERLLESLQKCGAHIVSIWDETYPRILKEIHDPPALLFIRGALPKASEKCIAIVGTRNPSAYGITQAHRIAEDLAARGVGIISGMARGVDSAAHEGCLHGGGKTYAVFGCGIDIIYPSENKSLAEKIANSGGLISEFTPGTEPDPGLFPRRNRIISGLSAGVLVIQGKETSGALITAKCALEQNREVFALPGNVEDQRSQGPHSLIRLGAVLATSAQDILTEIGVDGEYIELQKVGVELPSLNNSEEELLKQLSSEPVHIDDRVRGLNRPVSSVLADLLSLEMKGWVSQLAGKMFILKRR